MKNHLGMIEFRGKFNGEKKQRKKWVETGSEVIFDSVNEFTGGLLKHFGQKLLFNLSKSESCLRKWRREASNCVSLFLILCFCVKIELILYYFGVPVWKIRRNKLGGQCDLAKFDGGGNLTYSALLIHQMIVDRGDFLVTL